MPDEHGRSAGPICQAAPHGSGTEHVEVTLIRKFPGMLDLTHEIEGPKRNDIDRHLWILQIFAFVFRRDVALQLAFRAAGCPDRSSKRNRHSAGWIDVVDSIERVFAVDRHLYSVTGLDPCWYIGPSVRILRELNRSKVSVATGHQQSNYKSKRPRRVLEHGAIPPENPKDSLVAKVPPLRKLA